MELKERIIELREKKGISKKEVSAGTGIPYTTYIKYEYGQRELGLGSLQKLADFYGVSTDYILGRPNAKAPKDPFDEIETIDEMEKDLIKEWLNLDEKSRKSFLDVLRKIVIKEEARNKPVIDRGDVGVFTLNSCGYVKELGKNQLISYNEKYKPINFSADDDMTCWGKVLGKTTRVE